MRVKGSCFGSIQVLAAAAALAIPALSFAGTSSAVDSSPFTIAPALPSATPAQTTDNNSAKAAPATVTPEMMDAMPPETPNIHGFFDSPFKTGYLTPRGLYVQNSGISWQPVVGLVFPLGDFGPVKKVAFVGGIWNAVDTYEAKSNPRGGPWDEMDVFASFSGTVAEDFGMTLTYGAWNFPQTGGPHTEHNIDLKLTYSDHFMGSSGISINPYVDLWWAVAGSSTVVLGRQGGTGYIEPGIVPTYTYKGIDSYPITFTAPMYFSFGPSKYWDAKNTYGNSDFGLVSASLNASVPLPFIPAKYGFWHAEAGVTYDYLINNALLQAGTIVSGNTNRNCLLGSVGFGVNF